MKDHQLALLDRNQYPDRGIGLAVRPMTPGECSTIRDQDTTAAAAVATAAASTWAAKSDKALKRSDLLQVSANGGQHIVSLSQRPRRLLGTGTRATVAYGIWQVKAG